MHFRVTDACTFVPIWASVNQLFTLFYAKQLLWLVKRYVDTYKSYMCMYSNSANLAPEKDNIIWQKNRYFQILQNRNFFIHRAHCVLHFFLANTQTLFWCVFTFRTKGTAYNVTPVSILLNKVMYPYDTEQRVKIVDFFLFEWKIRSSNSKELSKTFQC